MILTKAKATIGPRHHGHKMTLKAFEFAKVEDGWLAELARGYIVVSEIANFPHMRQVNLVRRHLDHFFVENPDRIYEICGTMECKVFISDWDSERHPDIAVYLAPPRNRRGRSMWRTWFPELIIEVVSEGSHERDYTQKRDEYWNVGIKEYWIVDAKMGQVLILKRGKTDWIEKTLGPDGVCETKLLPGFKLSCAAIFAAATEV
ncbi:MAG: Uma2 family endonuclease [Planctomycetes bacterium]|nr:Uma2 family endonuclease [Planctomycetota bacterium]